MALRVHPVIRNLARAPGFSALVVLTLALGIGATTAMFSVVDAVLINPLPFPNADRIGEVGTVTEVEGRVSVSITRSTTATLLALRRATDLFSAVEAYTFGGVIVTGGGVPESVAAPRITPGLLTALGPTPALGRFFSDDDALAGRVVIVSDAYWAARFGRDPGVIGQEIVIDDVAHRVVGVMPRSFRYPNANARLWLPLDLRAPKPVPAQVLVWRRPELTIAQVNDRLAALAPDLRAAGVVGPAATLTMDVPFPLRTGQNAPPLYTLFGAVWLVLLVACVNVMNLMLVRASGRAGELAIMTSLGAGAKELVRGVLFESALLAAAGCAAGLALAQGLVRLMLAAAPSNLTYLSGARPELDWRAWGFAVTVAVATCVFVGLLPAWRAARIDAIEVLKQRVGGVNAADDWWQGALVTAQLSLVLVLLAGAGLLLRSFDRLLRVDPGYAVDELAVLEVQLPPHRYGAPGAQMAFMQDLEQRVEARAGVRAAISGGAPPGGGGFSFGLTPEADGVGPVDFTGVTLPFGTVSADYFDTMGISIVAGRTFTPADGPDAIVVNDVMARRVWGDVSPIGRRIRMGEKSPWKIVVGVAADVKQMGPSDPMGDGMEFYEPLTPASRLRFFALVMRSSDRAETLPLARQAVWAIDPKLPVGGAATMEARLGEAVSRPRFFLVLSSAFAATGVLLAAIGVYGVAAYWVSRRRRELAIRLALGASGQNVIGMVMRRMLTLAAAGAAGGLALAVAGTRVIESMLFQTDGRDPLTLTAVTALLGALALLACLGPAVRAARVDPMTTLRAE